MSIRIELDNGRTAYAPGETISGRVTWQADEAPSEVALSLYWYTLGKGTQDHAVVGTVTLDLPRDEESRPFRLVAPAEPYSFSGKLISLTWALRAEMSPGDESDKVKLVISPTRSEILLHKDEDRGAMPER
jgi:hypothetical protein